jgi:hypothetical protein
MKKEFTRREFMTDSLLGLSYLAMPKSFNFDDIAGRGFMNKENISKVDFSYAFSAPHRICISLPEASKKCLVDSSKAGVAVSWSDDDLTSIPLGSFYGPKLKWFFNITAEVNDQLLEGVSWKRVDNRLPALEFKWKSEEAEIIMISASAKKHDVFKFTVKNLAGKTNKIGIFGKTKDLSFNTKWIDPDSKYNASLAHYGDRSDRVLFFSTEKADKLKSPSNIDVVFDMKAGEEKTFYFIRPHKAIVDELESLMKHDWESELNVAINVWRKLLQKAVKLNIPDKMVEDAYYACFGDIFVARELNAVGVMAGLAGTNLYRCMNSCEPTIAATVLDQCGLYDESESVMKGILDLQDDKTGRWDDYRTWGHDIGWIPGPRSWWIKEHYLFTRDKKFLLSGFEHMYKHVKWAHSERQKTKIKNNDGTKPLTWGLLPRGMGDGGLMDGDDYYGYFIPSNVWHCFIIKLALWSAKELKLADKAKEVQGFLDDALECTLDAIRHGAILESDGTKWIPGVPGKTSGSRFAATNSIYPCELIDPFDELANGTLKKLESNKSEGGIPKDLGWLKGGLWVALALDNLAYAHIEREEYDDAAAYLYPTLNHGTPLYTWCEERLPEPGAARITGDIQHTWTPHIVNRFLRDCLLMERGNILHVASVTDRSWLADGLSLGVERANTHFGIVKYSIKRENSKTIKVDFSLEEKIKPEKIVVHFRLPEKEKKLKLNSITNKITCEIIDNKLEIKNGFSSFSAVLEII